MSTNYNGNSGGGSWGAAFAITEPADLDTLNVASVNTALSKLADQMEFIRQNAGRKGESNTWVLAQTFSALASFVAGLQATGAGAGPGVAGTGGATAGTGVAGTGGASSGSGASGTGGAPNGKGVTGQGTGTGAGIAGTGGATGPGVTGQGGSASGNGGTFTSGPSGVGVSASGVGGGVQATSTSSGVGVMGTGGGSFAGVTGIGGTSAGVGVVGLGGGAAGVGGQFQPGNTSAPACGNINLTPLAATPTAPYNGDLWVENVGGVWHLKVRLNGATFTLA
jgi:hypothetical protein